MADEGIEIDESKLKTAPVEKNEQEQHKYEGKEEVNKTQLNPDKIFERHVFHRDQFAHFLRWSFILRKCAPPSKSFKGERILDIGCGSANLAETLYRNRFKPQLYVGLDMRKQTIALNNKKTYNFTTIFDVVDVRKEVPERMNYTKICCFEVVEHFEKKYIHDFFNNIQKAMNPEVAGKPQSGTELFLSTPCFNGKAADNHVHEYTYKELKEILEQHFVIKENYGTFSSKREIMTVMTEFHAKVYEQLERYYDSNLMSVIFAPLYPEKSRNCMWVLKLRDSQQANQSGK